MPPPPTHHCHHPQGLMVILDNHSSDAIWCCNLEDGNGLWYTDRHPESHWLAAWRAVAARYASTPAVVGAGLRNEPRPALVGGRFVAPAWGSGGAGADFAAAYERAAAAVLAARASYLVVAQGLMAGRDLRGAARRPLALPPGRVVYEAHEYPWLWGAFNFTDFDAYRRRLDAAWGGLVTTNRAPVWLGAARPLH